MDGGREEGNKGGKNKLGMEQVKQENTKNKYISN